MDFSRQLSSSPCLGAPFLCGLVLALPPRRVRGVTQNLVKTLSMRLHFSPTLLLAMACPLAQLEPMKLLAQHGELEMC